jgi:uncharacterized membrane protein
MKALCTGFVGLSLVVLVGCGGNTGTSEKHPGGAVTNVSAKAPLVGENKGQFDLKPPFTATSLKQGESKEVKIDIKRGEGFDKDVTLKFSDVPKGVTIEPASPTIKHGDTGVAVKVKAADDAAVGDFKVKITGQPTEGKEAAEILELKIDKK